MRTQPKVSEAPRALPAAGRREKRFNFALRLLSCCHVEESFSGELGTSASLQWAVVAVGMGPEALLPQGHLSQGWRSPRREQGSTMSGKLDTVCSASHVHCWSQFPSARARMGMGYCSGTVTEDAGPGPRRLLWVSAAGLRNLGSQGVSLLPLRSKTPPCPWKDASMSVCSLCFIKKVHRNNRGSSLLKTSEVRLSLHWLVLGSQCFNKAFGSLCLPSAIPVRSLWGVAGFDMHWCTRGALLTHCCCGPPVAKQAPGFLDLSVTWQAQWTWSSSLAFLVDGLQISRECYNLCWEWQFGDFSSLFNVF